jgi:hypothetical protein
VVTSWTDLAKEFYGPILHKWINQNTLNPRNNAFRPSTSLDNKVPVRRASSISLGTSEFDAVGGAIPSRLFRRTSPPLGGRNVRQRLGGIRLLLGQTGGGLGVLCRGGEAIRGGSRLTRTSSRNLASRRAASTSCPHTRRQVDPHEEASAVPTLAPMAETGRRPRPTWAPRH